MKLLLLSDVECPALWEYYRPERLEGIDLIISCGDLKRTYLEFLVTMGRVPVFYVPGNHDGLFEKTPPEGCECIDGRVVTYQGVRFLGLGGSINYNNGPFQYTEQEMARRIRGLKRQLKKAGGVDIIVTHSPIAGCGDQNDRAHKGFECFKTLIEAEKPAYFIHGHVHRSYGANIPRELTCGETAVINAFERYTIEIPQPDAASVPERVPLLKRLALPKALSGGLLLPRGEGLRREGG
ncbi:MAG: metallophosphoesterase [Clostridia bacterium]|nr:metallophosphoesterase [Clostridia bacterium]